MNTTGRSLLVSLLALGLAACGGAAETSSDVVRTDSAGVRLITSGARDTVAQDLLKMPKERSASSSATSAGASA